MELNKAILVFLFFASVLSFSTEATFNIVFDPSSDSPALSPLPIINHHSSLHLPCKTLFSTHIPLQPLSSINPKLYKICAVTENPTKCATLISPCLSTRRINYHSTLNALIFSLSGYVDAALSTAIKLSKSKSLSPEVLIAINTSIEIYVSVIEDLKKASIAFKLVHDTETVKTTLTDVITKFGHCDEAFHQQGLTKKWPLKRNNQWLVELAGFGLDILKFITKLH